MRGVKFKYEHRAVERYFSDFKLMKKKIGEI